MILAFRFARLTNRRGPLLPVHPATPVDSLPLRS